MPCPCGSGRELASCCGVYHGGERAPTAEALMRSRYSAYVRGEIDYLIATHDPATRAGVDRAAIAAWSKQTTWLGLEIVAREAGGVNDETGIVEFIARGATDGQPFAQHERSRFRRIDGAWVYTDGDLTSDRPDRREPVRATAQVGRNEPCPCGSGAKYKKCHGRD
ncbi:MAG TPA: YchJ family protein [Kofleriaceae bacterium]|jgi:SEC-C motif-containing protein